VLPAVGQQVGDGHPVHPRCPAVPHDAPVRCEDVSATQHLLHASRSPVPGAVSACRARLTLGPRALGGSAACRPGLSTLWSASPSRLERIAPVRLLVFSPSPPCAAAPMALADCWPPLADPRGATSPMGRATRSPRVRRVTVAPSTRRIYAGPVWVTSGFRCFGPLAHRTGASYAVRVPRPRALPPASFPRRLTTTQLPFR